MRVSHTIHSLHAHVKQRMPALASGALRRLLPYNHWGDFAYALWLYRVGQGRFPSLDSTPSRYSDRLFRMKVDGTLLNPLRQFITDKEYVKYYIGSVVGWQHTTETYRVLHGPDEVDGLELERLPCVLKPTHSSGPAMFITDPMQTLDRELMKSWFEINYYKGIREQNYKHLRPKVIVEEFFSKDGYTVPSDYKVFCFDGVPKFVQVDSDRHIFHTRNLYDTHWNRLPFTLHYPEKSEDIPRPTQLDKMLKIAARLSHPFSFIRVDMYANCSEVKVGELTNCPGSANEKVTLATGEFTLGRLFEQGEYL